MRRAVAHLFKDLKCLELEDVLSAGGARTHGQDNFCDKYLMSMAEWQQPH